LPAPSVVSATHLSATAAAAEVAFNVEPVSAAIERRMAATGAPGASVAIVQNGNVVYNRGFGVRRIGGRRVDRDTRFEIGSLTKQFTAAAILQLKERRKLSLDDRLSKYIPLFPHAREITLLQLLHQTSGLPDYILTNHFVAISHSSAGSLAKIERMAAGPLHFAPGSRWEYSNTNYFALGRIIESVAGQSYDAYVKKHLFEPAGMQHSAMLDDESSANDLAVGYWRGMHMKGPLKPAPATIESWTSGVGNIISTAGDVARWDVALQHGKIISNADYALMTTPARLANGTLGDYAFHWWTDPLHGHAMLSGLGDTYGMSSCNDVFPHDRLAIVVLENIAQNPDGTFDAAAGLAAAAFDSIVSPPDIH
jgi:D-alanyl-D-alanine carboxypeptidase